MTTRKRITITVELPEELADRIAGLPEDERQALAAEALGEAAAGLDLGPLLLERHGRDDAAGPAERETLPSRRRRWDAFFREQDARLRLRRQVR